MWPPFGSVRGPRAKARPRHERGSLSRNSPLSYPAVNRYSSSSLSSQASAEVSNITGQSESSDEVFNMQVPRCSLGPAPASPGSAGPSVLRAVLVRRARSAALTSGPSLELALAFGGCRDGPELPRRCRETGASHRAAWARAGQPPAPSHLVLIQTRTVVTS